MPGQGRPHLLLGGLGQVPQAAGHAHQALLKGRHQVGLKEMAWDASGAGAWGAAGLTLGVSGRTSANQPRGSP